ncbi:unnamed protein product [Mycena citricolor]|uniref:Uncharacterized protein n=1 Tax=Mycena citricolor TaxID=2018698 RepID=A0AAD2H6Y9_9AGAR|nr:unnamed protein product [Mycena citricolor]
MVFGLFSRNKSSVDLTKKTTQEDTTVQLRTPSPSVLSGSSPRNDQSRGPPATPSPAPDLADPDVLHALIESIPPKALHAYVLARISHASPQHVGPLAQFFSALEPPPTLHCVRCHKGYFEVENNDRSCLIGHDDESAEVERVGGGYETLFGCCGKTVEGEGDMGPPDGWCYEGMHTTDNKRARFRADSTVHEDKLVSCTRLRCHDPRPRKRLRTRDNEDSDEDSDDDGASHSSVRTRQSKRAKIGTALFDDEDVDMEQPSPKPSSSRGRTSRAKSPLKSASGRSKPAKTKSALRTRSVSRARSEVSISSSPAKRKPASSRFVAGPSSTLVTEASFSSTTSVMAVGGNSQEQTQTSSQLTEVVAVSALKSKKSGMQSKKTVTVAKEVKSTSSTAKRKPRTKKLDEVVESSIPGETE